MIERLARAQAHVAGSKQVLRALAEGKLTAVYVARDADPFVTRRIVDACEKAGVTVIETDEMRVLGRACGLPVSAAAAGILKGS